MTTKVWGDPWVPGTQTGLVLSPGRATNPDMTVSEIICQETFRWNRTMVSELFLPFEQERILAIPLSYRGHTDTWCWEFEKDGNYSVRSAYKAITRAGNETGGASSSIENKWLWGKMWKCNVLPRIKSFYWQLCKLALPTRMNLFKRLKAGQKICPICERGEEDELHLFRDCLTATQIWELSGLDLEMDPRVRDFCEWMEREWSRLGTADQERFMTTCWAIWEMRNDKVFGEGKKGVTEVTQRVTNIMAEMSNSTQGDKTRCQNPPQAAELTSARITAAWTPPRQGRIKINVDAGVIEGIGSGFGVVCRGEAYDVKRCVVVQQSEVWEVRYAEAFAVLIGLEEARDAGYTNVIIESDCQEVVKALSKRRTGRTSFYLLLDDILSLCLSFESVGWSYVGRLRNKVAHALAHTQPWMVGKRVWDYNPPPHVVSLIALDYSEMEN